ncbi:MAG: T9SS type A sorting domain-containing protein, partial [Bacteroides sp.]|nr:T9SS type A sorting domain-containing protein [Bacteroides sp.]MCM1086133.1 T9SS type A sorting domain-containing protein [Bacteroides sp.]
GEANGWVRVTGENCSGEWYMEVSDSIPVVTYEAELAHYDGCVNIGLPDTLQLRVENIREGNAYLWDLPENWILVGCDSCGEIMVAVQEPIAVERTYGVRADIAAGCANVWKEDTVSIKGADTVVLIVDLEDMDMYCVMNKDLDFVDAEAFEFVWYKTALKPDNIVDEFDMVAKYLFEGEPPILAYRYKDVCWSTRSEVVPWMDEMNLSSFSTKSATSNRKIEIGPDIRISPNPTGDQVAVRWNITIDKIELLSENGQRQQFFTVSGLKQKTLSLYSLPSGIYFVRFLIGESVVAVKKLIKK